MPRLALVPLFVCAALLFAGPASAATFTVDDTGNAINSGGTTCASPCNLYQAITSSNNTPGTTDTIHFSTHHITLATPLPGIIDPVVIDGGTSSGKPATVLSGTNGNNLDGFILEAPNSTIENLVLNHFDGAAVAIIDGPNAHPDSDLIAGNYIGTSGAGTSCSDGSNTGNGGGGIVIAHGAGHQVGGFDASERNVIACNTGSGITVGANGSEAGIYNNYIGLLANGNSGSGQATGVSVSGQDSTVGTTGPGGRNVISGNTQDGVQVTDPSANGLVIESNYIGTDSTGTVARGNGRYGINVTGSGHLIAQNVIAANGSDGLHISQSDSLQVPDNNIGRGVPAGGGAGVGNGGQAGPALGNGGDGIHGVGRVEVVTATGNVIANNSGNGVAFDKPSGTNFVQDDPVAANYYSSNGGLGIDMDNDGVTGAPTTGSSNFADLGQQLPVLTAADTSGGHTTVQGTYHSQANREYAITLYPVSSCDPSGYGEGEATDFHPIVIQTDGSGDATFSTQLSQAVAPGSYVTATATDVIEQNASEFSRCVRVPGATRVTTDPASGIGLNGATINGSVNPDGVATQAHFEWGTTSSYGASTPDQSIGSDSTAHALSVALSGLAQGTTFHYRVVATNSDGRTTAGPDMTFTTASPPAPPVQQRKKVQCVVPKLRGKNLATIKKSLRKAHCKLGKVTRRHKHGRKKGRALGQSLRPGKHKPAGTKVNVVLEK